MLENKSILVTGGAGFMGSDFIRYLLSRGDFTGELVNLDLLTYAGSLRNLRGIDKDPRYQFVKGDICNASLVKALFTTYGFDLIVHFAAETHVDRSIDKPGSFIETNIVGTYTLLEAMRSHKRAHLHFISTDEVYGDLQESGTFTEESPYKPSSPYAASKAAGDHLVLSYARTYGLEVTVSHASNNFGPHQYPEKLIPRMVHQCLLEKELPLYGSGKQVRDWLYVRDHSEAVYEIVTSGRKGEVYNVAGQNERTNLEMLEAIIQGVAKATGCDPDRYRKKIVHIADRPGHDFRYAMDISKIKEQLGWEPKHSFEEALTTTIEEIIREENRLCYPSKASVHEIPS